MKITEKDIRSRAYKTRKGWKDSDFIHCISEVCGRLRDHIFLSKGKGGNLLYAAPGLRPKLTVLSHGAEHMPGIAWYDGSKNSICVNLQHKLIRECKGDWCKKMNLAIGLACHELAHYLYTDTLSAALYMEKFVQNHEWSPREPRGGNALRAASVYEIEGYDNRNAIIHSMHEVNNIMEDGYIEKRFIKEGRSKKYSNWIHYLNSTINETVYFEDVVKKGGEYNALQSAMLQYGKNGYCLFRDPNSAENAEFIETMKEVIDDFSMFLNEKDPVVRYGLALDVFVTLWPYNPLSEEGSKREGNMQQAAREAAQNGQTSQGQGQGQGQGAGGSGQPTQGQGSGSSGQPIAVTISIGPDVGQGHSAVASDQERERGKLPRGKVTSVKIEKGKKNGASQSSSNSSSSSGHPDKGNNSPDTSSPSSANGAGNDEGESDNEKKGSAPTPSDTGDLTAADGTDIEQQIKNLLGNATINVGSVDAGEDNAGIEDGNTEDSFISAKPIFGSGTTAIFGGHGEITKTDADADAIMADTANALMQEFAEEAAESEMDDALARDLEKSAKEKWAEKDKSGASLNDFSGFGYNIMRTKNPLDFKDAYEKQIMPRLSVSRRIQSAMKQILRTRNGVAYRSGYYYGKNISPSSVAIKGKGAFRRPEKLEYSPDAAFGILVDCSGSMCGNKMQTAIVTASLLYDACLNLHYPVAVVGHDTNGGPSISLHACADYDRVDERDKFRILSMSAGGCNHDGAALAYLYKRMKKLPQENKILIIISDGAPNGYNFCGDAAKNYIGSLLNMAEKKWHIKTIAAGIGSDRDDLHEIYGDRFLDISDLTELPKKVLAIFRKTIH